MSELNQELLKEYFEYRDGHLWWIKKSSPYSNIKVGQQAGYTSKNGYRQIMLYGKGYLEHRLIWLYHYGELPMYLDHINGDKLDNRPENLRICTNLQNSYNRTSSKNSSSVYKGVCWDNYYRKWLASYSYKGQSIYVGRFSNEEDAAKAYRKATEHLHKEYANYG